MVIWHVLRFIFTADVIYDAKRHIDIKALQHINNVKRRLESMKNYFLECIDVVGKYYHQWL
jgi:hypothetical protein